MLQQYKNLIISISLYLILAVLLIANQNWQFPLPNWLGSCLASLSFLSSMLYFNSYSFKTSFFNVESLFIKIIKWGLIAFGFVILLRLPDIFNIKYSNNTRILIELVSLYSFLMYFSIKISCIRQLIFERRDEKISQLWLFMLIIVGIAIFSEIESDVFRVPPFINFIIKLLLCISILIVVRLKWIAQISRKIKLLTILYIIIILFISLTIFFQLNTITVRYVLDVIEIDNSSSFHIYWYILSVSSILYMLISFITIIAAMPLSSTLEAQNIEIENYQEINKMLLQRKPIELVLEKLFNTCLEHTNSEAGWLQLHLKNEADIFHTPSLEKEKIEKIRDKINAYVIALGNIEQPYWYINSLQKSNIHIKNNENREFQSLLAMPIFDNENKLLGTINLLKSYTDAYGEYAIKLVQRYVNISKIAFENNQLIQETISATRYREEMLIAKKVQQTLLPKSFDNNPNYEVAIFNEAAKEIGGDYYDYNNWDNYRTAIVIGDVSGKGASAAFHMAQMKGIFQSLMQLCLPADEFMIMANMAVLKCLEKQFITLSYLFLDFENNLIQHCRAGHCPLIHYNYQKKQTEIVQVKGMGLGIIKNNSFSQYAIVKEFVLQPNDIFVLYTDGISEGKNNETNKQYELNHIIKIIEKNNSQSAEQLLQLIISNYKNFTGNTEDKDDATLIVLKIKA